MVGIDGMEQCICLGHMVKNGTVRPENSTRGTEDKNGSEGILSLTGYYRRFIPNFAGQQCHCQISPGRQQLRRTSGMQSVEIVVVWGTSAEMPRF